MAGVSTHSSEKNSKGGESLKEFIQYTKLFLSLSGMQKRCARN
jgi:hypothetical protein